VSKILSGKDVLFDAGTHTYTSLEGASYPSVTTVLKPWSPLGRVPEHMLEHARARGDLVHLATEMADKGSLYEESLDAETLLYLDGWRKFLRDWNFTVLGNEERVIHLIFGYAGTLDRYGVGTAPGGKRQKHILLDIKTGAPDPTHGPQTAAYARALMDGGSAVDLRLTVYLKPGDYKVEQHRELEDWAVFMAALQFHRWKERHGI
jgi:hypothetical protein